MIKDSKLSLASLTRIAWTLYHVGQSAFGTPANERKCMRPSGKAAIDKQDISDAFQGRLFFHPILLDMGRCKPTARRTRLPPDFLKASQGVREDGKRSM
jgi:hypothetical protein